MFETLVPTLVIIAVFVYCIAIYNGLIKRRNRVQNAFAQIDVQLQRRYDLIPNLVETVKKYMSHEKGTLEAVVLARNAAQSAEKRAKQRPSDGTAMQDLIDAESALGGTLTKLFALVEGYPDLKANTNMLQLQEELTSTENRVGFARQAYNDAVTTYNIKRESFPDALIAVTFGFRRAKQWEIETAEARQAVKVSMD